MNIQEYIESGIIELYVMNALPDTEKAEVEAMARQYPDIQAEIEEIQAVMQVYSQAHAVTPSPELKDKILDKYKADNHPETDNEKRTTDNEKPEAQNLATEIRNPTSEIPKPPLSIPTILKGLAALLLGGLLIYCYQQINTLKKEKAACEQEQNTQRVKNQKEIVDLGHKLDILKSPDTKAIVMKGLPSAPELKATVYWNAKEKTTLLTIQDLPKPAPDKQYQLWAIVDKKPVDAGVFSFTTTDIQTMKIFERASAFAITLEPQGGSTTPTLEKMYVIGTL
jgi:anti-sigma-K factor RskA